MEPDLFNKFAVSTAMLILCVAIHGVGLFGLNHALHEEASEERAHHITPLSTRGLLFTFIIVLVLITIHGIEIWAYAVLYMVIGAVPGVEDALYYSTISYSTVGYNDAMMPNDWRLLGAFESIAGMILIGWSTAFFFRMMGRLGMR